MKKITLLSGLVAFASISAVFATWTFSDGLLSKDANNRVDVSVDDKIELTGLNGTATLALNEGADGVVLTQSNVNEYGFKFYDKDVEDKVILSYELGENEVVHSELNASLVFEFKVDNVTKITWSLAQTLTPNSTNGYSYEFDLPFDEDDHFMFADFLNVEEGSNLTADAEMAAIDTISELNDWLVNSTFEITVSANVSI